MLNSLNWSIFQPWMIKYLINSIESKSVRRFSLNHAIDKICTLKWPSFRNVLFLYLNLFGKNLIPNLLPASTIIWPFSKHHFISNNPNCKIVNFIRMILTAKNLWSHISRCSTCIAWVIVSPFSSNSKICNSCISFTIQYYILRFNVTMYYLIFMQIFQT